MDDTAVTTRTATSPWPREMPLIDLWKYSETAINAKVNAKMTSIIGQR